MKKAALLLSVITLFTCSRDNFKNVIDESSKGSVKLSVNLGNFFIGGSGAASPWNHQYQESVDITFSSTTSDYSNTVSFDPNDLNTFPETTLPYDTYSWSITKTGDDVAVSDVLYIYGSSATNFTVDSPTTTVPLVLDTDFALVTVSTENLASASIRYNGTNTDLTTQDGYYFGYINANNTPYILQIVSTDDLAGMDTISDPVAYTHYNYQVTFDTPTTGTIGISLSLSQNFVIEDRDITAEADDDLDGVPNSLDECPDTPSGAVVDENGCPVPDLQVPSAPSNLSASNITNTSVELNWTASTDDVGVVNYEIFQDGVSIGNSGTNTTFNVTGLTNATTYRFNILAQDAEGNQSEFSNSVDITTLDSEAPSKITDLLAFNLTNVSANLNLIWTASTDNVGVVNYEIFQDGVSIGDSGTNTTFYVTGLTAATTYIFNVVAQDAEGNSSEFSNSVVFTTLDDEAPSAPNNLSFSNLRSTSVELNWSASIDNVGVTNYEIFQNGVSIGNSGTATLFLVNGLTSSTAYSFTVMAEDAAGNLSEVSNSVAIMTSFDTEAPSAPTNLNASNITNTSVELNWTASMDNEVVVVYEILKDGLRNADLSTNTNYIVAGLTPLTSYQFMVVAQDASGNVSEVSNLVTITTLSN